ncbi:MAG: C25 family cysteine peptidase [bacterium]|nr:C25 family cysteine peptidase [bacterium]
MNKIKFLVCGIIFFSTKIFALPNLAPVALTGWSAPLVCSITQDTILDDTLYTGTPYYYSWAVTNNGDQNVTSGFDVKIMREDSVVKSYTFTSLAVGTILKVKFLQSTFSVVGAHTMKLVVDPLGAITESSEADNEYTHSYYWRAGGVPDIAVTPDKLSYYYHIPDYKYVSCSWSASEVTVDIDVPAFDIKEASAGIQNIDIKGFEQMGEPGKPALPFKTIILAIPPEGTVEGIEVIGNSVPLVGKYNIAPAPVNFPMRDNRSKLALCYKEYNTNKQIAYSSNTQYPAVKGELISTGNLRKYNLATVAVYPVQYNAVTGKLSYVSRLQVKVKYRFDADKEAEYKRLASDNLAEEEASGLIYNFEQAKKWYPPQADKEGTKAPTYDYVIITTAAMQSACEALAGWKAGLGFKTNIVTKEWINTNYTGTDIQQKIRNFLRDKYPVSQWGIKYVLIVGDNTNIPMRICYIQSNTDLPSWAIDAYDYPLATDLYYSDLGSADNASWNKDGDGYWGEILTSGGSTGGNDSPDYVSEVSLGRIPWSDATKIAHITQKIINFERNTDLTYKKKALCAGAILQFSNQDNGGGALLDGASVLEDIMNSSIINRSTATLLYEKQGRTKSTYSCTDSLTKINIKNRWEGMGIFALNSHGWLQKCMRMVWATDDGDGVPETTNGEIVYTDILTTSDVSALDDDYPADAFLMSCLLGHPETTNNLAAALLNQGCVSVCAASRSVYTNPANVMETYFFNKLLKDTTVSHSKVGPSFDLSRQNYMAGTGAAQNKWVNCTAFNLYGDPSLAHFGYATTPCQNGTIWVCNRGGPPTNLSVSNITYTASWILGLSKTTMTLAPGESSSVSVTVQPAGLAEGVYRDTLRIASNDPDEGTYKEPVILTVSTQGVSEIHTSDYYNVSVNVKAYPNPFVKSTIISYQIPFNNKVSVELYDLSGRQVKTLVNGEQKAGTYNIKLDTDKLSNGIYFVHLKAGNAKVTGKLILMK